MPIDYLMKKNSLKKYLIETDILIEHLTKSKTNKNSFLIDIMQKGICFTSVLNASEMYFAVNSDFEKEKLDNLFYALNVLGIHSRYSLLVPKVSKHFKNIRDALFYILAEQNKLTIVTQFPDKYNDLSCETIHPSQIV